MAALCISGAPFKRRDAFQIPSPSGRQEHVQRFADADPKHPEYATLQARLTSFNGWSLAFLYEEDLARAGFYYTGIKDYVLCYSCGKGIKDWERGDNPWIEHGRWSPNCSYVIQCLGEEFARLCQSSNDEDIRRCYEIVLQMSSQNNSQTDDYVFEDLNSTAANTILNMGFPRDDVMLAIRYARQKYGSSTLQASHLFEYLLDNCPYPVHRESDSNSVTPGNNEPSSFESAVTNQTSRAGESYDRRSEDKKTQSVSEDEHLLQENLQLKEQRRCKVCMDQEACVVFIPCGHLAACLQCSSRLNTCAICRTKIREKVKVYLG